MNTDEHKDKFAFITFKLHREYHTHKHYACNSKIIEFIR